MQRAVLLICLVQSIAAEADHDNVHQNMQQALETGMAKMDTDSDGKVSREELHAHISRMEAHSKQVWQDKLAKKANEAFTILVDKYGADADGISLDNLLQARAKVAAEAKDLVRHGDHGKFVFLRIEWDDIVPTPNARGGSMRGKTEGRHSAAEQAKYEKNNKELVAFNFKFADIDHDGKLSRTEFARFHTPDAPAWHNEHILYAAKADIAELDSDGDGKLSFKEYSSKSTVAKRLVREDGMDEDYFKSQVDADKDGFATFTELVKVRTHEMSVSEQVGEIMDAPHFDGDGDGQLSLQELKDNQGDLGFLLHNERDEL